MTVAIICLIGYIFGCLHGSQLVGKYKKMDIKNSGVKNAGASNTTLLLGWKYGVIVGFIDIFKGTFSVMLASYILQMQQIIGADYIFLLYVNACFVILGHNYPLTMKFRGGKGTASLVGIMLALDWRMALIGIGALLFFTFITDYLVMGVLFMYAGFLTETFVLYGIGPSWIAAFLLLLGLMKHKENMQRLLKKEEVRISSVFRKQAG